MLSNVMVGIYFQVNYLYMKVTLFICLDQTLLHFLGWELQKLNVETKYKCIEMRRI